MKQFTVAGRSYSWIKSRQHFKVMGNAPEEINWVTVIESGRKSTDSVISPAIYQAFVKRGMTH
jgi:hypothetical protein